MKTHWLVRTKGEVFNMDVSHEKAQNKLWTSFMEKRIE